MSLDDIKEAGVKLAINQYFQDLGEICDIDIDTQSEKVSMLAILKGDIQKTRLELDYHLKPEALELLHFRCDRPWIENALNRYAAGRCINVKNETVDTVLQYLL